MIDTQMRMFEEINSVHETVDESIYINIARYLVQCHSEVSD